MNLPEDQVGLGVTVECDLRIGRLLPGDTSEVVFLAQRDLQRGGFLYTQDKSESV
jgi:hypothetical protein